ncbi:MAG TPA: hypothetical protein VHC69_13925 [Polyangiaceae bacterium]|nr:hypothetical protein [Polyangiaceae bacterium]
MRGVSSTWLAVAAAAVLAAACRKSAGQAPLETFVPGEFRTPKNVVIKPPDASNRDWRILVLQEKPRQKKNPHWKTIPIAESGVLEMPEGSHYKCIYNPVAFRPWSNEHVNAVERWELLRSVRCSNDNWATYSEVIHVVTISGNGDSVVPAIDQTQLSLHEIISGHPVDIAVVLRAD